MLAKSWALQGAGCTSQDYIVQICFWANSLWALITCCTNQVTNNWRIKGSLLQLVINSGDGRQLFPKKGKIFFRDFGETGWRGNKVVCGILYMVSDQVEFLGNIETVLKILFRQRSAGSIPVLGTLIISNL